MYTSKAWNILSILFPVVDELHSITFIRINYSHIIYGDVVLNYRTSNRINLYHGKIKFYDPITDYIDDEPKYYELVKNANYVDGILHGIREIFYYNGPLQPKFNVVYKTIDKFSKKYRPDKKCEHNYKNGKKHGIFKAFCKKTKQLYVQSNYVNGRQHGQYRKWKKTGRLYVQCDYVDGFENGIYKQWWPKTGQLHVQCNYVSGLLHGQFRVWDKNGKIICNRVKTSIYLYNKIE